MNSTEPLLGQIQTVLGPIDPVELGPTLMHEHLIWDIRPPSDRGDDEPLSDYVTPVHRVSEELPVLRLLDLFIKRREHLFLVEDEYGQTAGIVTLEDAVETLLGREIMDESDTVEDMQELARNKYRGRLRESR